jgi:hypothetical protein
MEGEAPGKGINTKHQMAPGGLFAHLKIPSFTFRKNGGKKSKI